MLLAGLLFGQTVYGETDTAAGPQEAKQEAQVKEELPELRTENSKTFKTNQPGVYVQRVSNEQMHYESEDGRFYEIATDLTDENAADAVKDKDVSRNSAQQLRALKKNIAANKKSGKASVQESSGSYYAFHVPFQVALPKNIAAGYSIGKGSDELTFLPQNAKPSKGKKDSAKPGTMLYENVWESTHIRLSVTAAGVKEDIVLLNAKAPNSFTFEVKGKLDNELKAGDLTLLPAWLEDSSGQKRDVKTIKRTAGNQTYLDLTWDDTGLVYPVTIDPSVNSQKTNAYYTCSNAPNTLTAGLTVGWDTSRTCMSFVQFSDFQLPASAQVTNVDLTVYGYNAYESEFPVTVRQLFTPITLQLNSNNQPVWLNARSVASNIAYSLKYETYRWHNLRIDTASFRTGMVQLGLYASGTGIGMLSEGSVNYGGKTQLEITYVDNPKSQIYQYDLNNRLTSIRSGATGHLVNTSTYDKNGNRLHKSASLPYYTLLENHDFREGSAMWLVGPNMSISPEASVDGNGSLKFTSAAATTTPSVTQSYPILTGDGNDYILSVDILDNTTSGKVYVSWKEYNNYYGEVGSGSQLVSTKKGQWNRRSISFKTVAGVTSWIQVQVVAETGTKGTAYVDSVRLNKGIYNAGFEKGLSGWSGDSYVSVDTAIQKEGSRSLKFKNSGSSATSSVSGGQAIPIDAGTAYNLSAWFYNDLTAGNISIQVQESAEEGSIVGSRTFTVSEQLGTRTWFNKNFTFTTNSKATSIIVCIFFNHAAGSAYVDHLQLSLS